MSLLRQLDTWLRPVAPARRLAMLRILVGVFGVVYLAIRAKGLASVTRFGPAHFQPIGVARLLDAPLPSFAVWASVIATVVFSFAFLLGYRYRITGPVFAALALWVTTYRSSFGMIFHTENLWILHVLVLSVTPAADALSLDARGRPEPSGAPRYGWPAQVMGIATVLAYVLAGVAKLRTAGFEWATSDALRNYVALDNVRKILLGDTYSPLGAFLVGLAWFWKPLAVLTLLVELCAPIALVSRRLARAWVVAVWGFHAGVLATMAILFPYQLFGVGFASFFEVERIADRFDRWRRARSGAKEAPAAEPAPSAAPPSPR